MHFFRVYLILVLGTLAVLPISVGAEHDGTWHPPDDPPGGGPSTMWLPLYLDYDPDVDQSIQIFGLINNEGGTSVYGYAWNRATGTFLVAQSDGTSASCSDTDNNGVAGFSGLEIAFRNIRTGDRVMAAVVPDGGDLEARGRYPVTIQFSGRGMPVDPIHATIHLFSDPPTVPRNR